MTHVNVAKYRSFAFNDVKNLTLKILNTQFSKKNSIFVSITKHMLTFFLIKIY
jgi:hypothetical protein